MYVSMYGLGGMSCELVLDHDLQNRIASIVLPVLAANFYDMLCFCKPSL